MMIEDYSFGKITIAGRSYTKDVIILPGRVLSPWWRKQGHSLVPEDLDDVLAEGPEVLVVGTGAMGVMTVPAETVSFLSSKGIKIMAMRTGQAVEEFNRLATERKTAAALHLTC